jgi:Ca2+-binding EF-hand superfamily protein
MKTPKPSLASAAFAFFFVASPTIVFAEEPTDKEKKLVETFKAADKDSDGKLTLPEATAGMPRVAKNFARIDKDKKGFVTLEQLKSMMK